MKIFKNLFILFFVLCFGFVNKTSVVAIAFNENEFEYNCVYNDKVFNYKSCDFKLNLSNVRLQNYHKFDLIEKLEKFGLSKEEIIKYIYPETEIIFKKLSSNLCENEVRDEVFVVKNKCELNFIEGKKGRFINKEKFYSDLFNEIKKRDNKININIEINNYKNNPSAKELFKEKSSFTTNFETSSSARKNNIKTALKSFDGIILNEGEVLSFNNTTGIRNEENGYQKAKIISKGTFVEDYGGGVCQVSTTLYNACLLAGLEIIEFRPHSLPVSYIEPSFDAMVSFGSSDLKIRNNSGGQIIITTSSENDLCKVKIFGLKNRYKITRHSEKIGIVKAEKDIIETDYERYGESLEIGEKKRLSFSKDGYISRGYLNYYNENGKLVKTTMIRENKYNATKGVILKREN